MVTYWIGGTALKHAHFVLPQKTPLHYAASNGHQDIVEYLIEKEADVNSKDKFDVWMTSLIAATL